MCNESLSHEARPLHGVSLSSCRRHPGPWCFRTVSINPTPCSASQADFQNLAAPKRGSALAAVWNTIRLEHITSGWLPWMATDPNSHRTFLSAAACTMIYSCRGGRLPVPCLSLGSLLSMLCLSLSCLLPVPCLCPACLLGISCLCSACLLPACCLCSACLLKVSCLCSACLLSACCLCPACLFGVSCLCSACFLSASDDDDDDDDQRRR